MEQRDCGMHTLVADVALITGGKVLLAKYNDANKYDHQQGWFLPDDALNYFEHPETAAKRILKEQLNVSVPKLSLGFIESFKTDSGAWHLAFHYKAEPQEPLGIKPSKDVKTAEWFPLNQLPDREEVAHHGWALSILREMIRRT
jgi:ADP-ribose pyrophosphatase YjhB (NUDIX family)